MPIDQDGPLGDQARLSDFVVPSALRRERDPDRNLVTRESSLSTIAYP